MDQPNQGADTVETCYAAGLAALERGDFDAAATHLQHAVELAPDDAELARQLGEALSAGGRLDEALAVLDAAARRHPDDPETLLDLGYARVAMGDTAGARAALERAVRARPDDPAIRRALGQVYETAGEPAQAAAAYAAVGDQRSPRLANDLARLYLQLGRYAEAEDAFQRLATLDPDDQLVAQHGLAWCRIKQGDWRGAFDTALGATRLDRFGLTTAFLAYAKDRLFGQVPDAAIREADLEERFLTELREHYELHGDEPAGAVPAAGGDRGEE